MESWSLENLIRTYKYIAVFASILYIFKIFVISLFSKKKLESFNISDEVFSFQSVIYFYTGFGITGYLLLTKTTPVFSVICSIIAGIIFTYINLFIIFKIKMFQQKH